MYQQGLSLKDIGKQFGKAHSTVRNILVKAGIELRPNRAVAVASVWRTRGKRNIRPPYGFCYFQGQVVPDPREYEHLLLIHRWWKEGLDPKSISERLNGKKIPPRMASVWNRYSVKNILERFKNKNIVIQGGNYELR